MRNEHVHAWVRLLSTIFLPLCFVCLRSRHAKRAGVPSIKDQLGTSERAVVRVFTQKVLKEARHCQLVLTASFPSRSSYSEVQAQWPMGADTHRHRCSTDEVRSSFGRGGQVYDGTKMGNDRQTEPKMKRREPTRVLVLMHKCISHV